MALTPVDVNILCSYKITKIRQKSHTHTNQIYLNQMEEMCLVVFVAQNEELYTDSVTALEQPYGLVGSREMIDSFRN